MNALKVELHPIDSIHPYEKNPRLNDGAVDAVANSITAFGWRQPIVVDGDGVIICGHTRWKAAKKLGLAQVPVHAAKDLTPDQVRAYRIADNQSATLSEWDMPLLYEEIAELRLTDLDISVLGFDEAELGRIEMRGNKGLTDPDEVPDPVAEPVVKSGELWLLGEHRLLCGDSTKRESVERLMDGDRAALCFTSPPYSDMREYKGGDMSVSLLSGFIPAAADSCGLFCVNLGIQRKDGEIFPYWQEYIGAASDCGLKMTAWNVWSKRGMGGSIANMSAMFPIEHEWLFVFGGSKEDVRKTKKNKSAGLHTGISNRQKDGTTLRTEPKIVCEYGRMGSVFESCYGRYPDHPAAYPVELPSEYIAALSDADGVVYDPFIGSGTTIIAAEQLGRRCYGIEISPRYVQVALERWAKFTGKQPTRDGDGATLASLNTHDDSSINGL